MAAALALLLALFACGSRGSGTLVNEPPPPPVEDDRCPTLPDECLDARFVRGEEGCPDAKIELVFDRDSAAISQDVYRALDAIAKDVPKLGPGMKIVVGGEAMADEAPGLDMRRALAVLSVLRSRGAPALAAHAKAISELDARVTINCE